MSHLKTDNQNQQRSARRNRYALRLLIGMFCVFWVATFTSGATAQVPVINREPTLKAAYLFHFTNPRYVDWPELQVALNPPFVIGTVGDDPVNPILQVKSAKRMVGNRAIQYKKITKLNDCQGCQIIFFSGSANPIKTGQLLQALQGQPILLVGEQPGFLNAGGTINYTVKNNRIKLQISIKNSKTNGLKIGSELAKLADIVN
ncbi:MAG: hypothetical protein COA78_05430 [Blastopirellula sp.]|nr:MAG: hypothetical protein COA78_05430 [Blastopirellula sp.]